MPTDLRAWERADPPRYECHEEGCSVGDCPNCRAVTEMREDAQALRCTLLLVALAFLVQILWR